MNLILIQSAKNHLSKSLRKNISTALIQTLNWFVENTDTMIIRGLAKYDRHNMPQGPIYTFAGQQLSTRDFADYIEKRGSMINTNDPSVFINGSLETCLSDQIPAMKIRFLKKNILNSGIL